MFGKKTDKKTKQDSAQAVTDIGPCRKAIKLHVAPSEIEPVRSAVIKEFQKQATLDGFRKGKAPSDLVAKRYSSKIHDETIHRVMRRALEQVVKEKDIRPVDTFEVKHADFSETGGLMLEATVEVEPTFTLGEYKGIRLTRRPVSVSPDELRDALAKLQESAAKLVPSGEGQPKEKQLPALDDELAKDLGYDNLEKLSSHLKAKLLERKNTQQAQALESSLCEELLKRHAFEVPEALVSHQTERLTSDFKARLLLSGIDESQVNEKIKEFSGQLRTNAERYVKISFLIARVAEREKIDVGEQELVARLWELSQRWQKDPSEVRKILDAQGLWPSVVSAIRREKAMKILMDNAVIDGGGST